MKISEPRAQIKGDQILISAQIEGFRNPLWFSFPKEWENRIQISADPFVVALLLLAMTKAQAMESEGPVSERLLSRLPEYQRIFHSWFPERFTVVEIRAKVRARVTAEAGLDEGGKATAFSGGVDSFYSLSTLSAELEPKRLGGALFMAGFDMPLNLKTSIAELTKSYSELMKEKGIPWVSGATNIREFVNTADWTNAHGPALAASALFFQGHWEKFYIPSSYREGAYPKWGTHPSLDSLLSTEALEFVHHGAASNRVRKLESLIHLPETYGRLRVCWIQDIGLKNCGECEKCLRTMIALRILGASGLFRTFVTPLNGRKIRALKMRTKQSRIFARELIVEALRRGKVGIAADLGIALLRRRADRLFRS